MKLKTMSLKDLNFYYRNKINSDEFPTFIHWVLHLRNIGEY